jgi:hypothetical protein
MRPDEFNDRLRRGAADVAAQADPESAGAVRRRGDRRRQRNMVASGLLAFVLGAGGGGYAYASISTTSGSTVPSTGTSQSPAPVVSAGTERPAIVAVTTGGAVVVLNSKTGLATSTLTGTQDVVGDEIAVTRSAVYFAVRPANSCADEIDRVSLAGGTPTVVATGVLPAVSPDGTELAYVKEELDAPVQLGCTGGGPIQVVVRDLTTGAQTAYPAPPGEGGLIAPVSHLSWSPDGKTLLVSAGPVQDNEGWTLSRLNLATATYYLPPSTQTASKRYVQPGSGQPPGTYFAEGVYLPGGDLFVNQECCTGVPVKTTPGQLLKVNGSGVRVGRVAVGYPGWVNSSLDAVPGWLLYLSRTDLFIAADGQPAKALSNFGFVAAAWVP